MSEHKKDTEFLRRIIVYHDTQEHRELEKRIAQVQCDEHCVQRVTSLAAFFTVAAMAGLAYVAILEENFPYNQSQLVVRIFCELGLASLICLMGFAVLLTVYRKRLNRLREECRRLVTKLVESHLGKSHVATLRNDPSEPGDREITRNSTKVTGSPASLGSLQEQVMDDKNNHPSHLSAA